MDSIFLDFHLPNAATWFYFSFLIAVAVFFHFTRLLAFRNWDLLALYLFVPGFLLIQDANHGASRADANRADLQRFFGYLWLLSTATYWLVRCLVDLGRVRRPVLRPNLNLFGLAWFGLMLFLVLAVVSVRRSADDWETVGKQPAAISVVKDGATSIVSQTQTLEGADAAREWAERGLAIAAHLAVVLGMLFIGIFHYREADTGVAMGTLYLLLPYTAYHFGQLHHVLPTALVVWAVFAYRRAYWAGMLLGLAAGSAFFPVLLFPIWLHFYWRRGAGRFATGFATAAAVGLLGTLGVLWAAGDLPGGINRHLHLSDWQPWKVPNAEGLWTAVHWAYRLPVFIVGATFVLLTFFWPAVRNLGHLLALSAATLITVQFWYADRGGQYVLWFAPLLILMAYRPSAAELEPPAGPFRHGWARRVLSAGLRRARGRETPTSLAA